MKQITTEDFLNLTLRDLGFKVNQHGQYESANNTIEPVYYNFAIYEPLEKSQENLDAFFLKHGRYPRAKFWNLFEEDQAITSNLRGFSPNRDSWLDNQMNEWEEVEIIDEEWDK